MSITCDFPEIPVSGLCVVLKVEELLDNRLTETLHRIINLFKRLSNYNMCNTLRDLEQTIDIECSQGDLIERIQLSDMLNQVLR